MDNHSVSAASHAADLLTQSRFVLDKALKLLDFSSEAEARFKLSPRTLSAELLLKRDDGSLTAVPAWRVQHATRLSIGPLRLATDLDSTELQAQAVFYSWQSALLGLPFQGAAGGILTQTEFSALSSVNNWPNSPQNQKHMLLRLLVSCPLSRF